MNGDLRARIATLLGWTEAEVTSFSLPALRELVRPTSKKLTHELDLLIQGGVIAKPRDNDADDAKMVDELPRDQKTRDGRRAVWLTDGEIALLIALMRGLGIENHGRLALALKPFDQTTNVEGYL